MEMGIFCIKMLGSGMVVISGTMLGYYYGAIIQKRFEELSQWRQILYTIYGQISYGGMNILEIMGRTRENSTETYEQFFRYIEDAIMECGRSRFQDIWKEAVEKYMTRTHLQGQELAEIQSMGQYMGNVDKEQQLALLKLHIETIESYMKAVELEKQQKMKLYQMLGCLGSIFVVVLLI